jgi:hypothetical protein
VSPNPRTRATEAAEKVSSEAKELVDQMDRMRIQEQIPATNNEVSPTKKRTSAEAVRMQADRAASKTRKRSTSSEGSVNDYEEGVPGTPIPRFSDSPSSDFFTSGRSKIKGNRRPDFIGRDLTKEDFDSDPDVGDSDSDSPGPASGDEDEWSSSIVLDPRNERERQKNARLLAFWSAQRDPPETKDDDATTRARKSRAPVNYDLPAETKARKPRSSNIDHALTPETQVDEAKTDVKKSKDPAELDRHERTRERKPRGAKGR